MVLRLYSILALFIMPLSALADERAISTDQLPWAKKFLGKHLNIIPPAETLFNTLPEPNLAAPGFQDLYNGTDLSGWQVLGGKCLFEAHEGHIKGCCVPGEASTYLCTEKENYQDFIFTVEIKWEVSGNSGIQFRSQQTKSKSKTGVRGFQCEAEPDQSRGWSGALYHTEKRWVYPLWLNGHTKTRTAQKPNAWNRFTIQAKGNQILTWVNGVPASHYLTDTVEPGFFGLQIHKGTAGTVLFRNIQVKELHP